MTKGLKDGEPNGRDIYPDIIDHPHWQSPTRPHMSLYDRAAQFSPFDALTGYSDMISEEQRLTEKKIELSETALEKLNQKFKLIDDMLKNGRKPVISITYFEPDLLKDGGRYETITGQIARIDVVGRKILLSLPEAQGRQREIRISDITDVHGESVEWLEPGWPGSE